MASKTWDIGLCALCALLTLVVALLGIGPWLLRAPPTLPLVLVMSGWSVTSVLHPAAGLSFKERLAFAVGLSLAVAVLGGVVLNITPWGLRPVPWALYEGGFTLLCCGIGLRRGYRGPAGGIPSATRVSLRDALLIAAAVVVTGLALALGSASVANHHGTTFTAFAIQPDAGSGRVRLSVENQENRAETYVVRVMQGAATLHEWSQFVLGQGQSWTSALQLPSDADPSLPINAYLYRTAEPDLPYRSVSLAPSTE
jgi:uncharacterized membrane protein